MPEGHTIHRQAREHNKHLRGHLVHADSPQGRFAAGAALLDGRTLIKAEAIGKHLFQRYDGGLWLHVHLGLYGSWRTGLLPAPTPKGAIRLRLLTEQRWWELRGATACEVLNTAEVGLIRDRLGPDPLRPGDDPDRAYARISRSRAPIGGLLMDQSVLAGVGNVYRAEVLFRHRLHPRRPGREVSPALWTAMWDDLVLLLKDGVRKGRIVTTATYPPALDSVGRKPAKCASRVFVYRRDGEPCLVCGTPVAVETMLARNLFWCPTCQPARSETAAADVTGTAAG